MIDETQTEISASERAFSENAAEPNDTAPAVLLIAAGGIVPVAGLPFPVERLAVVGVIGDVKIAYDKTLGTEGLLAAQEWMQSPLPIKGPALVIITDLCQLQPDRFACEIKCFLRTADDCLSETEGME